MDDYVAALFGKMDQVLRIAKERGCAYILQPGDFFDKATPPLWLLRNVIWQLKDAPLLLVVMGQHDQRYHHGDRANTPLGVLEAVGTLRLLGAEPYPKTAPGRGQNGPSAALKAGQGGRQGEGASRARRKPSVVATHSVRFYGASWGEDVPVPQSSPAVHVLLTHRMVIQNKLLWPGQTDYAKASALLTRNSGYDLILTGDNHTFFVEEVGGRFLVNCGSLMRTNTDQGKHQPSVVIYDTTSRKVEIIRLDVAPASKVLRAGTTERAKTQNAELEVFVEQVGRNRGSPDLDFVATLKRMVKEADVPVGVSHQVDKILAMSSHEPTQ